MRKKWVNNNKFFCKRKTTNFLIFFWEVKDNSCSHTMCEFNISIILFCLQIVLFRASLFSINQKLVVNMFNKKKTYSCLSKRKTFLKICLLKKVDYILKWSKLIKLIIISTMLEWSSTSFSLKNIYFTVVIENSYTPMENYNCLISISLITMLIIFFHRASNKGQTLDSNNIVGFVCFFCYICLFFV